MEDFFTDQDYSAPQITEYQPPHTEFVALETPLTSAEQTCISYAKPESA